MFLGKNRATLVAGILAGLLWLIAIIVIIVVMLQKPDEKVVSLDYTIYSRDANENGAGFKISQTLHTKARPFFEIMQEVAEQHPNFRFEHKMNDEFGAYITEVNGIKENLTAETSWLFLKVRSDGRCATPVGVSSYIPADGDHLMLSLENWSLYNVLPKCDSNEDVIYVTYSMMRRDIVYHVAQIIRIRAGAVFFDVMNEAALVNDYFRFEYVMDADTGPYITEINGIKANLTANTEWRFFKVMTEGRCLVPEVVGQYQPAADDHVMLSLEDRTALSVLPACGDNKDVITVTYSVLERRSNFRTSQIVQILPGVAFIEVMKEAAAVNILLNFEYVMYDNLGAFITEVNGIKENKTAELSWIIHKLRPEGRCRLPVGVSSYLPLDGEHLMLSLEKWSLYDVLPECGDNEAAITVTYSVLEPQSGLQMSHVIQILPTAAFLDIMNEAAAVNSNFRFEHKVYEGLGAYISEVGGIEESVADQLSWSFTKVRPEGRCVMPVGVSSYMPVDGDHLMLRLENWSVSTVLPQCGDSENAIRVTYSVVETQTNFRVSQTFEIHPDATFFKVMQEAAVLNEKFSFEYVMYEDLGAYISEINGIKENVMDQLAWLFLKVGSEGRCRLPVGVSSYVPSDGDHLMFSLQNWSTYEFLPKCDDSNDDDTTVTYSVMHRDSDLKKSLMVKSASPLSFIKIMNEAAVIDPTFRFEYVMYENLEIYVTEVNGIKENATAELAWFFLKVRTDGRCLMPNLVSTYFPGDGDHLMFSLENWSMYGVLPKCDDSQGVIAVTYSVMERGSNFRTSLIIRIISSSTFMKVMDEAAVVNDMFRYEYVMYANLGAMITEVNGIKANVTAELAWMFLKVRSEGRCQLPVGVSSYIPTDGDHMMLSLEKWSLFQVLPRCDDDESVINVKYSVNAGDDKPTISQMFKLLPSAFIEMMKEAAVINARFRFEYKEVDGESIYVTSINGVQEDPQQQLTWMYLKVNDDDGSVCLIGSPASISTFEPQDGDHIMWTLDNWATRTDILDCDSEE